MSNNTNIDWQHIIKTSEDLLQMAEASLWDKLPDAANQRDKLIRMFFKNNPVSSTNAKSHKKYLKEILDIDSKIVLLTKNAQLDLNGEVSELRKGSKATQAYNNCP